MANAKKAGYLEDNEGNPSSMRVMCGVALIAAIGFGYLTLTGGDVNPSGVNIVFGFLIAAFAPKAVQKFAEKK